MNRKQLEYFNVIAVNQILLLCNQITTGINCEYNICFHFYPNDTYLHCQDKSKTRVAHIT